MTEKNQEVVDGAADDAAEARRAFIKKCGKFAVVTPPAIVLLLTATGTPAFASHDAGGGYSKHHNTGTLEPPPTVGHDGFRHGR